MIHKVFINGEEIATAELAGGVSVEGFSGATEVTAQEVEISEKEFNELSKLKTSKGRTNKLNDILKDRNMENE